MVSLIMESWGATLLCFVLLDYDAECEVFDFMEVIIF